NAFLYEPRLQAALGTASANFLVSGQGGSATVPGNGDTSNVLIGRHSQPVLSSTATNLVAGAGATSSGYLNTLVAIALDRQPLLASGSLPNSLVGYLSTYVGVAGQYVPPKYTLASAVPFGVLPAQADALVTGFQANYA